MDKNLEFIEVQPYGFPSKLWCDCAGCVRAFMEVRVFGHLIPAEHPANYHKQTGESL